MEFTLQFIQGADDLFQSTYARPISPFLLDGRPSGGGMFVMNAVTGATSRKFFGLQAYTASFEDEDTIVGIAQTRRAPSCTEPSCLRIPFPS